MIPAAISDPALGWSLLGVVVLILVGSVIALYRLMGRTNHSSSHANRAPTQSPAGPEAGDGLF